MNRFNCFVIAALLVASGGVYAAEKPTNIVFMIADDWSAPHAGILGDTTIKTPTFDRIAREGVLFNNAFVCAPSCTPSRHAVLTGQYHWRLNDGVNLGGSLRKGVPVFTDLLRKAGWYVGRWGKGAWPSKFIYRGGPPMPKGGRFPEFLKKRKPGQPFFYWFGGADPHRPYEKGVGVKSGMDPAKVQLPPDLPDTPEVRSDLCDYYWEVQRFDRLCGEIMKKLKEIGELDNTLIVMTSDNGMPFPRYKGTLYDGGTHMPFALRWGKTVKAGRRVNDFITFCDMAPTFLEIAGLAIPKVMTGQSILDIIKSPNNGQVDPKRTFALSGLERHTFNKPMRAIRTSRYLLVRNYKGGNWGDS